MSAPDWAHADVDPTFARKAVDFVLSQKGSPNPFFLYLAASAAHEPCVDEVVPPFARGRSAAGPRGDLVWLFDWMVGQVVEALARIGRLEDTAIFVTSDNGALPGDRVLEPAGNEVYRTYGHKSCADWRGYKSHIWEGGHREPLVACWPGSVEPDSACDALVCLNDIVTTVSQMADAPVPEGAARDSRSFLPLLLGRTPGAPVRTDLIHHSVTGVFSIRRAEWKLIHETLGSGGWPPPSGGGPQPGSPGQLYNLAKDPGEERNLFGKERGIVRDLTELLELRRSTPG